MKSKLSACLVVLLMIVSVSAGTVMICDAEPSDMLSEAGASRSFLSSDLTNNNSEFILSIGSDDSFTDSVCIKEITSVDENNKLCIDGKIVNAETTTISVSDVEDLNILSEIVNGTYTLDNSSSIQCSFAGYTVILTEDVEFQELKNGELSNFKPIGNESNKFNGTFDGQGHKISNLIVNISSNEQSLFAGLFGHAGEKSIIKNLGMVDSNIFSDPADGRAFAGGITGCNDGTIVNCYNTGKITATSKVSNANAGGIAGKNEGTITNCYNTGEITATFTVSSDNFYADSGGIAGYNVGGTVTDCYNTGEVSAGSKTLDANSGGIAGINWNEGTVSNCYNTGKISAAVTMGSEEINANSGGIAGENYGVISNCYNSAELSVASEFSSVRAGGITGENYGVISNCYNTGEINSNSKLPSENLICSNSGGIAAGNEKGGAISNCYNVGKVLATSENTGSISGGIAGYSEEGIVSNCYNTGEVSADSITGPQEAYCSYSGGIAGYNMNGKISNCYNTGEVNSTSADSDSTSGGIAGLNRNGGIISNCYNTGLIGSDSEDASSDSGGIAGVNDTDGTISNCYNTGKISDSSEMYVSAGGIAGENTNGGIISNCYNTGEVIADSASTSEYSDICAGGITGYNMNGKISNCYNTGEVSATSTDSSKDSKTRSGGIAGVNDTDGIISNCYNIGNVSISAGSSNAYTGGIAGLNNETISDVFYLDTSALKGVGEGEDVSIRLTSEDMKGLKLLGESEYNLNTDDLKTWSPDIFNINDGYPILADVSISQVYLTLENETSMAQNHLEPMFFGKNSSLTLKANVSDIGKDVTYQWYMLNEKGVFVKINSETSSSMTVTEEGSYMVKMVCDNFIYSSFSRTVLNGAEVSFDSNGGSEIASQVVDINANANAMKPADPVKEGYTFAGWYSDKELTTEYDFNSPVSDNMTLYAKWDKSESGSSSSSLLIGGIAAVIVILIIIALAYYFMKKKKQ